MKKRMTDILYFHGLDSSLSDEKRNILNPFGNVIAPTFNYRDPKVLLGITDLFDDLDIETTVVIGSSFGGYLANVFSVSYDMPCLLFNPALAYRSVDLALEMPLDKDILNLSFVVLGKQDEVIHYEDSLNFISQHFKGPKQVVIEEHMGHRVPVDIFEKYTRQFFKFLKIPESSSD